MLFQTQVNEQMQIYGITEHFQHVTGTVLLRCKQNCLHLTYQQCLATVWPKCFCVCTFSIHDKP